MLINALNDYYDFLAEVGKVAPPGTSSQKITHRIMLRNDGTISRITAIRERQEIDVKDNVVNLPGTAILPERTQKPGIDANIIEHRPLYIFGLNYDKKTNTFSPEDKTDKAKKSHDCFVKTNLEYTEGMMSEIVTAYRNFIKNWVPENETENPVLMSIAKEYSGASFIFCLAGDPGNTLHSEDGEIMRKVKQNADAKDQKIDGVCAVTGKPAEIAKLHDKIKGIRGGQASGGLLVSYNNSAFESYGKTQSYNGSISKDVMKRYTEALNILISDPKLHIYLEDLTVIFWAMSKDDSAETDLFKRMGGFGDDKANASKTEKMLAATAKDLSDGKAKDVPLSEIDENVTFYVVGLAPNSSRIAQKFICRDKYINILDNAKKHQEDMRIDDDHKQISIWSILFEMKSPKSNNEKVPPPVIAAIFGAILNGTRYPDTLLETIVRRVKIDKTVNYVRAGIIKACINRTARLNNKKEEITMSLDKTNTNQAYLCGRLFAVLEHTQKNALGNLNRSIKDLNFSTACSTPVRVFPNLVKLTQHHLKKDAYEVSSKKLMCEIIDKLETQFPTTLSPQEQGKFIIGYYHQVQDFYRKNDTQNDKQNDKNNE